MRPLPWVMVEDGALVVTDGDDGDVPGDDVPEGVWPEVDDDGGGVPHTQTQSGGLVGAGAVELVAVPVVLELRRWGVSPVVGPVVEPWPGVVGGPDVAGAEDPGDVDGSEEPGDVDGPAEPGDVDGPGDVDEPDGSLYGI